MPNSIIEVNNLSKSYTISHEPVPTCTDFFGMQSGGRERYIALRDVKAQKAKMIFSLFHFVKKGISHQDTKAQRVILRMTLQPGI